MQIICPHCRTGYAIEPERLGREGRSVRCARCRTVWFVAAPTPPLAAADPLSPADAPASVPPAPLAEATAASQAAETDPAAAPEVELPVGLSEALAAAAAVSELPARATEHAIGADAGQPPAVEAAPAAALGSVRPEHVVPGERRSAVHEAPAVAAIRRRARRRMPFSSERGIRLNALTAAILLLAAADLGLILWRHEIVRFLPQTATLYAAVGMPVNLRNLSIGDVRTAQEVHDGVNVLIVEGTIRAERVAVVDVPRLRFSIHAANGHEVYAWTAMPARTKLARGETLAFRTRLASPPVQGRRVQVRFFHRRDLVAGLR